MGGVARIVNATARFVLRFGGLLLALVGAVVSAAVTFAVGLSVANLALVGGGLLAMPLAESHTTIGPPLLGIGNRFDDAYNAVVDLLNDLIACLEPFIDLWNLVVRFVLTLARLIGEAFGASLPQWPEARGVDASAAGRLAEVAFARAAGADADPALAARARHLAIQVARGAHVREPQVRFLAGVCAILRPVWAFLIDLTDLATEAGRFFTDLFLDIFGVAIDGSKSFLQILVEVIIDVILRYLDPCRCFGDFPDNFPRSIFKCACFWNYKSDQDVPTFLPTALVGCLCPGTNTNDFVQAVIDCTGLDVLYTLFAIIESAVNEVRALLASVQELVGELESLIDKADGLLGDLLRSQPASGRVVQPDGTHYAWTQWNRTDGILVEFRHTDRWDRTVFASGEHFFPNPGARVRPGAALPAAAVAHVRALQNATAEHRAAWAEYRAELRDYAAWLATQPVEPAAPRWSEPYTRILPFPGCPLPIDTGARAPDASAWALAADHADNYFARGLAESALFAAAARAARHGPLPPDVQAALEARTMCPANQTAPSTTRPGASWRALRHVLGTFREALADPRAWTERRLRRALDADLIVEGVRALGETAALARVARGDPASRFVGCRSCLQVDLGAALGDPAELGRRAGAHLADGVARIDLDAALAALEGRLAGVEAARAELDHGRARQAVLRFREQVLLGAPAPQGRVVGLVVTVGAAGAITLGLGVVVGGLVLAGPLLPVVLLVLTLLLAPLLGVLIDLGVPNVRALFGAGPSGFDPFLSFLLIIGPQLGQFYAGGAGPSDIPPLLDASADLALANLEAVGILAARQVLQFAMPFATLPPPAWDPATGAAIEGFVDYVDARVACEQGAACTISAGEPGADSLGECSCSFFVAGLEWTRAGTAEDPCPGGETVCWPYVRKGRYIAGADTTPDTPPDCTDFGFDDRPMLLNPGDLLDAGRFADVFPVWWNNWKAVTRWGAGLLAGGAAIPIAGLLAWPLHSVCPCLRPITGPTFRYTLYTQALSLVYPQTAAWTRDLLVSSGGVPWVGDGLVNLASYFVPAAYDGDQLYCVFFHVGPWAAVTGLGWILLGPLVLVAGQAAVALVTFAGAALVWLATVAIAGARGFVRAVPRR